MVKLIGMSDIFEYAETYTCTDCGKEKDNVYIACDGSIVCYDCWLGVKNRERCKARNTNT